MSRIWRIALIGVALLALGGTAVGFVAAQTDGDVVPGSERLGSFLSRLAENLGISEEELESAIDETQLDLVDEALAEGRIGEEQAAEARERIESGEGPGFFGRGFRGGGFSHGFGMGVSLEELAEFLGVESPVITDGFEAGQSLAQIAEANGKTREELKSFLLSELEAKFSDMLENAPERIDDIIDREGLPFKGGHGGFGGGFRFPGHFGPNGDDTDEPTSEPETEGTTF